MSLSEGHVKTEAEIGVMCLQAKERQGLWQPPEVRRGMEQISPQGLRGDRGPADTLI